MDAAALFSQLSEMHLKCVSGNVFNWGARQKERDVDYDSSDAPEHAYLYLYLAALQSPHIAGDADLQPLISSLVDMLEAWVRLPELKTEAEAEAEAEGAALAKSLRELPPGKLRVVALPGESAALLFQRPTPRGPLVMHVIETRATAEYTAVVKLPAPPPCTGALKTFAQLPSASFEVAEGRADAADCTRLLLLRGRESPFPGEPRDVRVPIRLLEWFVPALASARADAGPPAFVACEAREDRDGGRYKDAAGWHGQGMPWRRSPHCSGVARALRLAARLLKGAVVGDAAYKKLAAHMATWLAENEWSRAIASSAAAYPQHNNSWVWRLQHALQAVAKKVEKLACSSSCDAPFIDSLCARAAAVSQQLAAVCAKQEVRAAAAHTLPQLMDGSSTPTASTFNFQLGPHLRATLAAQPATLPPIAAFVDYFEDAPFSGAAANASELAAILKWAQEPDEGRIQYALRTLESSFLQLCWGANPCAASPPKLVLWWHHPEDAHAEDAAKIAHAEDAAKIAVEVASQCWKMTAKLASTVPKATVEQHSRAVLVAWTAAAVADAAARSIYPLLACRAPPLSKIVGELGQLSLCDAEELCIAAALEQHWVNLNDRVPHGAHIAPGLPGDDDAAWTLFADSFATTDSRLLDIWKQEYDNMERLEEAYYNDIKSWEMKKKASGKAFDDAFTEHRRAQLKCSNRKCGGRGLKQQNWHSDECHQKNAIKREAEKARDRTFMSRPQEVQMPLPKDIRKGLHVLFFLYMPPLLHSTFVATACASISLRIRPGSNFEESLQVPTIVWYDYFSQRKVANRPVKPSASGSFISLQSLFKGESNSHLKKPEGLSYPDGMDLTVRWHLPHVYSSVIGDPKKTNGLFERILGVPCLEPFVALPRTLAELCRRENLVLCAQHQLADAPAWLTERVFVALGRIRAAPNAQVRIALGIVTSEDMQSVLVHAPVRALLAQALREAGPPQHERPGGRLWRSDLMLPSFVSSTCAKLENCIKLLQERPRDFAALPLFIDVAAWLAAVERVRGEELLRLTLTVAEHWLEQHQQGSTDAVESARLGALEAHYAAYAILALTALPPAALTPDDAQKLALSRVRMTQAVLALTSKEPLQAVEAEVLRALCSCAAVLRVRLADNLDSKVLTRAAALAVPALLDGHTGLWVSSMCSGNTATLTFETHVAQRDYIRIVRLNVLKGTVTVDGALPSKLPNAVTAHILFSRVFRNANFDVLRDKTVWRTTKLVGGCTYEFSINDSEDEDSYLCVTEVEGSGRRLRLVSPLFLGHIRSIPEHLRYNFSAWLAEPEDVIFFRDVHFLGAARTGKSTALSKIFTYAAQLSADKCTASFYRLPYPLPSDLEMALEGLRRILEPGCSGALQLLPVHDPGLLGLLRPITRFVASQHILPFSLPGQTQLKRLQLQQVGLGLCFELRNGRLVSEDFVDYALAPEQQLVGTLTGFNNYLVLETLRPSNTQAPTRLLLAKDKLDPRGYVVWDFDRFEQLGAGSTGERLALAAAHLQCASALPERATGVTGVERALQLLRQSWSNAPFDDLLRKRLAGLDAAAAKYCMGPKLHSFALRGAPALRLLIAYTLRSSLELEFLHGTRNGSSSAVDASLESPELCLAYLRDKLEGNERCWLKPSEERLLFGKEGLDANGTEPIFFHAQRSSPWGSDLFKDLALSFEPLRNAVCNGIELRAAPTTIFGVLQVDAQNLFPAYFLAMFENARRAGAAKGSAATILARTLAMDAALIAVEAAELSRARGSERSILMSSIADADRDNYVEQLRAVAVTLAAAASGAALPSAPHGTSPGTTLECGFEVQTLTIDDISKHFMQAALPRRYYTETEQELEEKAEIFAEKYLEALVRADFIHPELFLPLLFENKRFFPKPDFDFEGAGISRKNFFSGFIERYCEARDAVAVLDFFNELEHSTALHYKKVVARAQAPLLQANSLEAVVDHSRLRSVCRATLVAATATNAVSNCSMGMPLDSEAALDSNFAELTELQNALVKESPQPACDAELAPPIRMELFNGSQVAKELSEALVDSWRTYKREAASAPVVCIDTPIDVNRFQALLESARRQRAACQKAVLQCIAPDVLPKGSPLRSAFALSRATHALARPSLTDALRVHLEPSDASPGVMALNPLLSQSACAALRAAVRALARLYTRVDLCARLHSAATAAAAAPPGNSLQLRSDLLRELTAGLEGAASPASDEPPEWLLFEAEQGLLIRRVQRDVAAIVHNSPGGLVQLNMGEGKSKVIVPMLLLRWANGSRAVRLNALTALLPEVVAHLERALGGLLQRRVYTMPFERAAALDADCVAAIERTLLTCQESRGILVVAPEHRLSLRLKWLELAREGESKHALRCALSAATSIPTVELLDESDELLRHSYQLIYSVGAQQPLAELGDRLACVQAVLRALNTDSEVLAALHSPLAERDAAENGTFAPLRLINDNPEVFAETVHSLLFAALHKPSSNTAFGGVPAALVTGMRSFTLNTADMKEKSTLEAFLRLLLIQCPALVPQLLMLRGLLAHGVLEHALRKRHLVEYGVNTASARRVAVPFKAKDVAAERTEYGHADIMLVLTHLHYYYAGLTRSQMREAFAVLLCNTTGANKRKEYYTMWLRGLRGTAGTSAFSDAVPTSAEGLDLDNEMQLTELHRVLYKNAEVVNFWLSEVVMKKEAVQFPQKLVASAWDLAASAAADKRELVDCSSRGSLQCATNTGTLAVHGFSGTDDSKRTLPLTVRQLEALPALAGTNGKVLDTHLHSDNSAYHQVQAGWKGVIDTFVELHRAAARAAPGSAQPPLSVLIDAGALMTGVSNEDACLEVMRELPGAFAGAVHFNATGRLTVLDAHGRASPLAGSGVRPQDCFVYLDDAHTRGTDVRLGACARGAVTVGRGVQKDKLVQAAMRLRGLGRGQTVCFLGPAEVSQRIADRTDCSKDALTSRQVLEWALFNTATAQEQAVAEWVRQGTAFYAKHGATRVLSGAWRESSDSSDNRGSSGGGSSASDMVGGGSGGSTSSSSLPEAGLLDLCAEPEVCDLETLYGGVFSRKFVADVASQNTDSVEQRTNISFNGLPRGVQQPLQELLGKAMRNIKDRAEKYTDQLYMASGSLDGEYERELEVVKEAEIQRQLPPQQEPAKEEKWQGAATLVEPAQRFVAGGMQQPTPLLQPLTLVSAIPQALDWAPSFQPFQGSQLLASRNFMRVLLDDAAHGDLALQYMRPVGGVLFVGGAFVCLTLYEAGQQLETAWAAMAGTGDNSDNACSQLYFYPSLAHGEGIGTSFGGGLMSGGGGSTAASTAASSTLLLAPPQPLIQPLLHSAAVALRLFMGECAYEPHAAQELRVLLGSLSLSEVATYANGERSSELWEWLTRSGILTSVGLVQESAQHLLDQATGAPSGLFKAAGQGELRALLGAREQARIFAGGHTAVSTAVLKLVAARGREREMAQSVLEKALSGNWNWEKKGSPERERESEREKERESENERESEREGGGEGD